MKRIYICAPYRGDIETNRRMALAYARRVKDAGYLPFCPHLYFDSFCDEATERDLVMAYCREEVRRSDEVWVFGDNITDGMREELLVAAGRSIPIREPVTHANVLQRILRGYFGVAS